MTYIGLSPPNTFTKSTSQTFTGNGSTTAFTLQTRVSSPEDLEVFVSNVQQQPTESYTIGSDGVTMTFSEAPPSGTFYVIYRTVAQQAGTDTGASRLGENNTFTGTQTFNADVTFTGANYNASWDKSEDALKFTDGAELRFGTGDDLTIKQDSDGSHSRIIESGSGNLFIQGENLQFRNRFASKTYIRCMADAEVELYHNNSQKLETTSTGVAVTGNVDMNGGEVILDADADTSITADTDDQIDLKVGGTDTIVVKPDVVEIKGSHPDLKLMDTDDNNYGGLFYNNGSMTLATDHDATGATGIIKFAIDGNEDVRIDGGGDLTINDGDLVIGTSGHGIDFSATGDGTGSMSSEILDDYEEGTWSASLISGGGITFSASERNYVKVGRLVYVNLACSFSGTSSNRVDISGLPFTVQNTSACTIFHSGGSLPTHGAFLAQSHSGHNRMSGGKGTDMTYSDVSGTTMRITVCYVATA